MGNDHKDGEVVIVAEGGVEDENVPNTLGHLNLLASAWEGMAESDFDKKGIELMGGGQKWTNGITAIRIYRV